MLTLRSDAEIVEQDSQFSRGPGWSRDGLVYRRSQGAQPPCRDEHASDLRECAMAPHQLEDLAESMQSCRWEPISVVHNNDGRGSRRIRGRKGCLQFRG